MNLRKKIYLSAMVIIAASCSAVLLQAQDAKPKYSVKDVMKTLHKGEDTVGKRVASGKGSKEEIAQLVEYYSALTLNEPPRGDKGSWEEKTTALVTSAKALQAGKPGALESYKSASNCKACHNVHKPK